MKSRVHQPPRAFIVDMTILTETIIEAKQTLQELESATACARMKMNEVKREEVW